MVAALCFPAGLQARPICWQMTGTLLINPSNFLRDLLCPI